METIDIREAETDLARLVERAADGETFVIARDGKPLVKLVPADAPAPAVKRRIGFLKGQISVPDDFDTMGQEEIIKMFEGEWGFSSTRIFSSGLPVTWRGSRKQRAR